jgi:hypothetical protein
MKYKIYLSYNEAHLIRCKDTTIGNFPQVLPSVRIFDANSIDDVKSNITEMRKCTGPSTTTSNWSTSGPSTTRTCRPWTGWRVSCHSTCSLILRPIS